MPMEGPELLLDKPPNDLDATSGGVAIAIPQKVRRGTVIAITHDRSVHDSVVQWMLGLLPVQLTPCL